jgi:hypothetical protein
MNKIREKGFTSVALELLKEQLDKRARKFLDAD